MMIMVRLTITTAMAMMMRPVGGVDFVSLEGGPVAGVAAVDARLRLELHHGHPVVEGLHGGERLSRHPGLSCERDEGRKGQGNPLVVLGGREEDGGLVEVGHVVELGSVVGLVVLRVRLLAA